MGFNLSQITNERVNVQLGVKKLALVTAEVTVSANSYLEYDISALKGINNLNVFISDMTQNYRIDLIQRGATGQTYIVETIATGTSVGNGSNTSKKHSYVLDAPISDQALLRVYNLDLSNLASFNTLTIYGINNGGAVKVLNDVLNTKITNVLQKLNPVTTQQTIAASGYYEIDISSLAGALSLAFYIVGMSQNYRLQIMVRSASGVGYVQNDIIKDGQALTSTAIARHRINLPAPLPDNAIIRLYNQDTTTSATLARLDIHGSYFPSNYNKVIKSAFTGNSNITKVFNSPVTEFSIKNLGTSILTFTINGMSIDVEAGESFDDVFDQFQTVSIVTTSAYKALARG